MSSIKKLGVWGILLDFFLAFMATIGYRLVISQDNQYNLGEIITGFIVFLGLIFIVWIYYTVTLPALMDNEKQLELQIQSQELRVSIDGEWEETKIGETFRIGSMYDDVVINDLYVILEKFDQYGVEWKNNPDRIPINPDKPNNSKYVEKNLQWIVGNEKKEMISLKPRETGRMLLIQDVNEPEFLKFETTFYDRNDSWRREGIYLVWGTIYGKVGNETKYRKRYFCAYVEFIPNNHAELYFVSYVNEIKYH